MTARPSRAPGSAHAAPRGTALLLALAAAYAAAYLGIALARMSYPFELEWIEGGLLQAMRRVLEHRPLYAAPALDYIAFNYPPLYAWLAALVAHVVGDSFLPLRLVSFASSLVAFATAALLVWTETRDRVAALLAAGLLVATFRIGGAWFDVARADSLHLALVLLGFLVLRRGEGVRSGVVAGALFTLAFLTKQSAAMIVAPVALAMLWKERTRGIAFAAVLAAGMAGSTLALDAASHGWYAWYLFVVPRHHPLDPHQTLAFLPKDLVLPLGLALLVGAAFLLGPAADEPAAMRGPRPGARLFYGALFLGAVGNAWFQRMFPGGYANVLMPAHAAVAVLFGLGWHALARGAAPADAAARARLGVAVTAACALQFVALAYDPLAQVPSASDRAAGERLVGHLRETAGDPLVPSAPYLLRMAGKPDHFHEMAFVAVEEGATGDTERRLAADLERAVRAHRWSVVVLHTRGWLGSTIANGYEQKMTALSDPTLFWPVTGMRTRPEYVWLPRSAADSSGTR